MINNMGKYLSKNKIDNIIDTDTCAICLSVVIKTNKDTVMLECNHFYHKNCIDNWLTIKNSCPLCIQITTYTPQKEKDNNHTKITIDNNRINTKKTCKIGERSRGFIISLLLTFTLITQIANVCVNFSKEQILNKNYVKNFDEILIETNEICINNTQDNISKIFHNNINNDYYYTIILSIYCIFIFITVPLHYMKNTKLYIFIFVVSFIIANGLNIYQYIMFRPYLNEMEQIPYCKNIYDSISFLQKFSLNSLIISIVMTFVYKCFMVYDKICNLNY